MRRHLPVKWVCVSVTVAVLLGCNEAPFPVAPVSGKVTLDGRPLTQGKVMFAPVRTASNIEVGKPAIGVIQRDGSFVLTTYRNGDGAVVGEHWVTVFGPERHTVLSNSANAADDTPVAPPVFERLSVADRQLVRADTKNTIDISLTTTDVEARSVRSDIRMSQ